MTLMDVLLRRLVHMCTVKLFVLGMMVRVIEACKLCAKYCCCSFCCGRSRWCMLVMQHVWFAWWLCDRVDSRCHIAVEKIFLFCVALRRKNYSAGEKNFLLQQFRGGIIAMWFAGQYPFPPGRNAGCAVVLSATNRKNIKTQAALCC